VERGRAAQRQKRHESARRGSGGRCGREGDLTAKAGGDGRVALELGEKCLPLEPPVLASEGAIDDDGLVCAAILARLAGLCELDAVLIVADDDLAGLAVLVNAVVHRSTLP